MYTTHYRFVKATEQLTKDKFKKKQANHIAKQTQSVIYEK